MVIEVLKGIERSRPGAHLGVIGDPRSLGGWLTP